MGSLLEVPSRTYNYGHSSEAGSSHAAPISSEQNVVTEGYACSTLMRIIDDVPMSINIAAVDQC
jgi:hypothetical protein